MKNLLCLVLAVILGTSLSVFGQQKEVRKAKRLMKTAEYHKAIPYLHLALSKNATEASTAYQLAKCYKEVEDYKTALIFYNHAYNMNPGVYQDINLRIAEIYHMNNQFEEAAKYYEFHKESTTGDSIALMDHFITQCKNGLNAIKDTAIVQIKNLGYFVNTRYPDYAPVLNKDFTAMRFTTRRPRKGVKQYQFAVYHHDVHEDIYDAFLETSTNIWHKTEIHKIKSNQHEAGILTSPDGNEMFMYISKNGGDIYKSVKKGKSWSKPEPLKGINSKHYEPSFCFSEDFGTIYFSSNRPGGRGGLDLYSATKSGDSWSEPTLLNISTPYDDDAPFIMGEYLYFSSRSDLSTGNYDIFRIKISEIESELPERLPYPLNTGGEDVFYSLDMNAQIGYFSSNRPGGIGGMDLYLIDWNPFFKDSVFAKMEEDRRKDSVYKEFKNGTLAANNPRENSNTNSSEEETTVGAPIVLRGSIFDGFNGYPVKSEIQLIDVKTNEVVQKAITDPKVGKFVIPAFSGKKYRINVEAPGFVRHFEDFYVPTGDEINVQPKQIALQKIEAGNKIILGWHFFDYNKANLKSESIPELNNLIELMKTVPMIKIKVVGHTDSDGSDDYNQKLSEGRASSVKQYIVNAGIEPGRVEIEGKGEKNPLYDNNNLRLKNWNRRVEISIVE